MSIRTKNVRRVHHFMFMKKASKIIQKLKNLHIYIVI